jgi:hypothetical protein
MSEIKDLQSRISARLDDLVESGVVDYRIENSEPQLYGWNTHIHRVGKGDVSLDIEVKYVTENTCRGDGYLVMVTRNTNVPSTEYEFIDSGCYEDARIISRILIALTAIISRHFPAPKKSEEESERFYTGILAEIEDTMMLMDIFQCEPVHEASADNALCYKITWKGKHMCVLIFSLDEGDTVHVSLKAKVFGKDITKRQLNNSPSQDVTLQMIAFICDQLDAITPELIETVLSSEEITRD